MAAHVEAQESAPADISAELEAASRIDGVHIGTVTAELIQISVERANSALARVSLHVHVPARYPEEPLIPEVSNALLPLPLLKKITALGQKESESRKGSAQLVALVQPIHDFVCGNRFVPCWKELRKSMQLVQEKGGVLKANEKTGELHLKVTADKYELTASVTVAEEYPAGKGVTLCIKKSTFPAAMVSHFDAQANELVRRCVAGYSPDDAVKTFNRQGAPPMPKSSGDGPIVNNSAEHMRSLKNDMAFLKRASDLREVNNAKDAHNATLTANSAQERRFARRELAQLSKAEAAADAAHQEKLLEAEASEARALALKDAVRAAEQAQPSLEALVGFIVSEFVTRLPTEECQVCCKRVMPASPTAKALTNPEHPQRPIRVYCGHWFHHECLDQFFTRPPFAKPCGMCNDGRRVYHPDWPQDVKVLERAWANEQARQREIDDAADLFN